MSKSWLTYLLLCPDGKLYCGVTNDMEKRLSAHNRGIASLNSSLAGYFEICDEVSSSAVRKDHP